MAPSGTTAEPQPLAPLATPPPSAVAALATQPSTSYPAQTNVPTAAMSAHSGEDPLVGKTLVGRYAIVKKLGEGGMGSVYLATHIVLEKQVALKILHGEYARKPDLVERFMQEAKAASRIRHENVIDISDFGVTEEGLVFFAMELLKGSDLHELIARARLDGQVLPWDRSIRIFLQICSALAAAHAHGIVHRDLKPENIYLIEFLGRPDFVKLLDFGIAKLAESEGGERKLTRTGMLFGTPEYMSPEQARGDKVDHRVDIYAMACILFQLLTGRVPFEAENFMGVLSLHLTEPPPEIPLATLERCGAPPEVAAIVAKGLRKNRDERWQTIEEMADALRALVDSPGAPAPGDPMPSGRTRTRWTGKLEVPRAEAARPPRSKVPLVMGGALLLVGIAAAAFFVTRMGSGAGSATATDDRDPAGSAAISSPTPGGEPGAVVPTATPVEAPVIQPSDSPGATVAAPPPAPLPATVTISFRLARGVTLVDPAGKTLGKSKVVKVVLPGSDTPIQYTARGRGMRERQLDVIPDRDASVEVALEPIVTTGATAGSKPSAPAATPTSGSSSPAARPTAPVAKPDPPATPAPPDDDIEPKLKPFEGTKPSGAAADSGTP